MSARPKILIIGDAVAPSGFARVIRSIFEPLHDRYELHRSSDIHFGGEIGFLYGKSTGSGFGREDYAGYVIGTVGNEHFSLTAGFYRQETSFNGSRFRR